MLLYLLFMIPPMLLALAAQWWISSAYKRTSQIPARMNGAMAARRILDANGLRDISIELVPGHLSDHYDPATKVVRLSPEVYEGYSLASVGIAAHEVGHAIQDAKSYSPLVLRNLAVPAAGFGSSLSQLFIMGAIGLAIAGMTKFAVAAMFFGVALFSAVVIFQVINLPVEFDASSRAKTELISQGIVNTQELGDVSNVLTAAAMTYVAATIQSVAQLAYHVIQLMAMNNMNSSDD